MNVGQNDLRARDLLAASLVLPLLLQPSTGFSPDASNLPDNSGAAWNPVGRDLLSIRYRFPMVTVEADAGADLLSRAYENAAGAFQSYPMHAVNMLFYMGPDSLTSSTCLTDSSCLPLGGQSVWSSVGRLARAGGNVGATQKPIVLAAVGMDARSLFHPTAFGANTAASGLVAMLAAADALANSDILAADLPFQARARPRSTVMTHA
ncbi:hypothetical protein EON66_00900 [archaeon]|nr:MAG: hypothetical protein EON66_00900 [archaeon]